MGVGANRGSWAPAIKQHRNKTAHKKEVRRLKGATSYAGPQKRSVLSVHKSHDFQILGNLYIKEARQLHRGKKRPTVLG